jgi:hypothetical protein
MPKRIALPEATVAILRERRVIWNPVFQSKATEPAVGKIQMDLFAEAALGPNAETITDDQHPDHQFGGNRRPTGVAVVGGEVLTQLAQIKKVIHPTQQMIRRNVILKVERIRQSLLTMLLVLRCKVPPSSHDNSVGTLTPVFHGRNRGEDDSIVKGSFDVLCHFADICPTIGGSAVVQGLLEREIE